MIQTIEELSLNAWPALQTMLYDGWLLRFSGGYTPRANSVNPLYLSSLPPLEKIEFCQREYRARGLPAIFKLTPTSQPPGLDEVLSGLGWSRQAPTSVQVLDLKGWERGQSSTTHLSAQADSSWQEAFARMSGIALNRRQLHEQILAAVLPATCYAAVHIGSEIAACGLGILQGSNIGLYDIVTDARFRRQGYALRVVRGLLDWGASQGAQQAYLQVMLDNTPALSLYSQVGFGEIYQYWYRVGA